MAASRKLAIANDLLGRVIDGRAPLLCDGGMGTLIQQAGLARVHEVPDLLNLTHANEIRELQRRYVEAGSDCIATNTFSSNRLKLAGTDASVDELYAAAARIARETGAQLVAGDIGPTGKLLAPLGPLSFGEAYDIFAEQARAAHEAGCDLIFLETFADLPEAKAALLACVENTPLPVFATMTFGEDGRSFMGTTPAIAATTLSALGASAVGINCSLGPARHADGALRALPAHGAAQRRPAAHGSRWLDRLRREPRGVRPGDARHPRSRRTRHRRMLRDDARAHRGPAPPARRGWRDERRTSGIPPVIRRDERAIARRARSWKR